MKARNMLRPNPSPESPTTSASIIERMPLSSQGNFGNMVGFEMREVEIGKLGCVATFPLLGVPLWCSPDHEVE
jgi:hypothetical protein